MLSPCNFEHGKLNGHKPIIQLISITMHENFEMGLSNSPRDIGNADIYLINYPNIINCSWHATLSPEIIKIHKNDIASLRK